MTHAWIIDCDHLAETFHLGDHGDKGIVGPRDAQVGDGSYEQQKADLARNYQRHHQFRMYDDDKILYYTGTLYWDGGEPTEEQVYSPLGDFGMPNAGAVFIHYTGKPEWDCG